MLETEITDLPGLSLPQLVNYFETESTHFERPNIIGRVQIIPCASGNLSMTFPLPPVERRRPSAARNPPLLPAGFINTDFQLQTSSLVGPALRQMTSSYSCGRRLHSHKEHGCTTAGKLRASFELSNGIVSDALRFMTPAAQLNVFVHIKMRRILASTVTSQQSAPYIANDRVTPLWVFDS